MAAIASFLTLALLALGVLFLYQRTGRPIFGR